MTQNNIRIVLVSPIYGGNVGSVCRAMANMGFSDLAIAAPPRTCGESALGLSAPQRRGRARLIRPGAPRPINMDEARMMACHATEILDNRTEFPSLAKAVADCGVVMGATARKGLYRQHARTPREWASKAIEAARTGRAALVFGREDNGLTNEEMALCTQIIQIPTTEEHPSLNVAQAVMICCYELFLANGSYEPLQEKSPEAPSDLRERMFAMWRDTLLRIGFMKEDKADHMMHGLRRILSRGALTVDDVHILMGIARQADWARGQRPEARGQRSEVRGQRPEVRGQRSEARGQRSEARGQRPEVRGQRSEVGRLRLKASGFAQKLRRDKVRSGGCRRRNSEP